MYLAQSQKAKARKNRQGNAEKGKKESVFASHIPVFLLSYPSSSSTWSFFSLGLILLLVVAGRGRKEEVLWCDLVGVSGQKGEGERSAMALPVSLLRIAAVLLAILPFCATHPSPGFHAPREFHKALVPGSFISPLCYMQEKWLVFLFVWFSRILWCPLTSLKVWIT